MLMHLFEPRVANIVGVDAAIIFQYISSRTDFYTPSGATFVDGRIWLRASAKDISMEHIYFTEGQIRKLIKKLIDFKFIMSANLNDDKRDGTLSYTVSVGGACD